MTTARTLFLTCQILGALSQSLKSCGGPNDHLKNPVITLTPDPIKKGSPFTIDMSGELDGDIDQFNSNMALNVTALGIIHASVNGGFPMSLSPAAPKGTFKLTIGPISIPSSIPGTTNIKGQVHVVNGASEPIMCLDFDMNIGAMDTALTETVPEDITSCGKATDHMPDFKVATSSGVTTITGTLDEDVTSASMDMDVKLKVSIISVPLKMTVPIAVSQGLINKGAIKAIVGPSTVVVKPDVKAHLTGTVKMNDGNGEEITCLNLDVQPGVPSLVAMLPDQALQYPDASGHVVQVTCPKSCTTCQCASCKNLTFPLGKCTAAGQGAAVIGQCSGDGKTFTEHIYLNAKCQGQEATSSVINTDACIESSETHQEIAFFCEKSTTVVV